MSFELFKGPEFIPRKKWADIKAVDPDYVRNFFRFRIGFHHSCILSSIRHLSFRQIQEPLI